MGAIFWLAGYPESGTTLVSDVLTRLVQGATGQAVQNPAIPVIIPEGALELHRRFYKRPLAQVSEEEFARRRPGIQAAVAKGIEGFQLMSTHSALVGRNGLPTINLQVSAAALYLVRNPIDIAAIYGLAAERSAERTIALMEKNWRVTRRTAKFAAEVMGSWSEHVASWTGGAIKHLKVVRYEDLLAEPKDVFRGIAEFAGIGTSDRQIGEAVEAALADLAKDIARRKLREDNFEAHLKLVRASIARLGYGRLTTEQVARVIRVHQVQMRRFGYLE